MRKLLVVPLLTFGLMGAKVKLEEGKCYTDETTKDFTMKVLSCDFSVEGDECLVVVMDNNTKQKGMMIIDKSKYEKNILDSMYTTCPKGLL